MQPTTLDRPSRWLRRGLLSLMWLALFAAVILGAWAVVAWLDARGVIAALQTRGGLAAAVALTLIHTAVAVSPAPGEAVALANSAIYGFGWGVVMNWTGWMLAAVVEFYLMRRTLRAFATDESATRWMPHWLRQFQADHPLFLIAGRWVPFGGHVVNLAAASKATFWRHCWCAAISIVPVAVLFSALANGWRIFS